MTASLNILVVENDPNTSAIIEVSLSLDPLIVVRTARTGAEAFEIVTGGIIAFDLLLIDATMPDMSGLRLIETLAHTSKYARLPVVVLAGAQSSDQLARFTEAGVLAIMAKPFDPLALASDLRDHLARR